MAYHHPLFVRTWIYHVSGRVAASLISYRYVPEMITDEDDNVLQYQHLLAAAGVKRHDVLLKRNQTDDLVSKYIYSSKLW